MKRIEFPKASETAGPLAVFLVASAMNVGVLIGCAVSGVSLAEMGQVALGLGVGTVLCVCAERVAYWATCEIWANAYDSVNRLTDLVNEATDKEEG